jgi:hypothetical protein
MILVTKTKAESPAQRPVLLLPRVHHKNTEYATFRSGAGVPAGVNWSRNDAEHHCEKILPALLGAEIFYLTRHKTTCSLHREINIKIF